VGRLAASRGSLDPSALALLGVALGVMLGLGACSLNPQPTPPGPERASQGPTYAPPSDGVDSTPEGESDTEANSAGAPEPGASTSGAGDDSSFDSEGESPPPTGIPVNGAGGAAGSDADFGGAAGAAGAAELI